jgi:hypothetical protein
MTTDNFCFYFQNRLIQTSQTGGQWYSDTSPFSIPWSVSHSLFIDAFKSVQFVGQFSQVQPLKHFRLEAREDDLLPPLPQALERHVRLIKDGDSLGVQVRPGSYAINILRP